MTTDPYLTVGDKSPWLDSCLTDTAYSSDSLYVSNTYTVTDNCRFQFSEGFSLTGAELRMYLKALQKIVAKDYPEEFFNV